MKPKSSVLVTLADKNYIEQAKQLFSSAYWNGGWDGDYLLLAQGIPESELKWFRNKGILIKKCTPLHNKEGDGWPPITLSKFHLFTPYFKKWDNILFLDGDIIVRSSIKKLSHVKGFWAVEDITNLNGQFKRIQDFKGEGKEKWIALKKELAKKYNLNYKAFNSGVMAFTTDLIEKETFAKIMTLFEKYRDIYMTTDQSILNLIFSLEWKKLPQAYNLYVDHIKDLCKIDYRKLDGIILHVWGIKPWKEKSYYYAEWEKSLTKGDKINLKRIPSPKRIWAKKEINTLESYLRRKVLFALKYAKVDRKIGLIGLKLKRRYPKLYYFLKRFKILIKK